jgi:hypothetical protein
MIDQLHRARKVSVPLIAITTSDPAATIAAITADPSSAADLQPDQVPIMQWDVVRGLRDVNTAGRAAVTKITGGDESKLLAAYNLTECLSMFGDARVVPKASILFVHNAHRWCAEPPVAQAAWNLRDVFKRIGATLILIGPDFSLPPELAGDVVVLDDPYPSHVECRAITASVYTAAGLDAPEDQVLDKAARAISGLSAASAEQAVAMSMRRSGVDLSALWALKEKMIENVPGLSSLLRSPARFENMRGNAALISFLQRLNRGRRPPGCYVLVDEIEKMIAGQEDTSGTNQDILGAILAHMEDNKNSGCVLVGPPGTGKTHLASAAGNDASAFPVKWDGGAMKNSLVGQSGLNTRLALKTIQAISGGEVFWIATCNNLKALPPELLRRFKLGIYFVDLPSAAERAGIWDLYRDMYEIRDETPPPDDGWSGDNIKTCCDIAYRLAIPLSEAAREIIPAAVSAAKMIESLRREAHGRYKSASYPGTYRMDDDGGSDGPRMMGGIA